MSKKNEKPARAENNIQIAAPDKWVMWKWIGLITIITMIAYGQLFSDEKQFTNWDDVEYVTEQPLIQSLDGEHLAKMFDPQTQVLLNYHPLTMLSLAVDYSMGYDTDDNVISIKPFVRTNLLFHLLNTVLVFFFLYQLSRGKVLVAGLAALLFGIHPMHVESVAWISARKDLLYCFFFLLSCISYLRYSETNKYSWLLLSFILFIASCLSKAMAVPLPFVLILTDIFNKRKIGISVLLEKLPFVLFAVWIGMLTVGHQDNAIMEEYTHVQRIVFGCYAFVMYLVKLFVPVHLSALYPYPNVLTAAIPTWYYAMVPLAVALLVLPVWFFYKKKPGSTVWLWGMGFYVLMILLVVQFVTVGRAIISDRYTYVSYLGPLFLLSTLVQQQIAGRQYHKIILSALALFVLGLSLITYRRVLVWENSKTLWEDAVSKFPYELDESVQPAVVKKLGAKTAYKNLAHYYAEKEQYDSAFAYYNVLARFITSDPEVWSNLGNIYAMKGNMPEALKAYRTAIYSDSANYDTYFKRGLVFSFSGMYDSAIRDFDRSIALKADYEPNYVYKGNLLLITGRYQELLTMVQMAAERFPGNADIIFYRGVALNRTGKAGDAEHYLKKAILLNPQKGNYYHELSEVYKELNNKAEAEKYAAMSVQYGYKP